MNVCKGASSWRHRLSGRNVCSELQRCLAVLRELHAHFSTQDGDSHAAQAPDAHHPSANVFTLCPNQLGLGVLLLVLFRTSIKYLLCMLLPRDLKRPNF